ncbi:MAG: Gfo/Idh/MocA family oxidoreductase [Planctomycetota bacterium]|nr:Gfo/Idh/MocA family oxidoreductase [Planctomycetota bacterium]
MTTLRWNRRDMLKASAAALALPSFVPARVLGAGGRPGANEQVRIGVIGPGGRAGAIVAALRGVSEAKIVALCDCYLPIAEGFAAKHGKYEKWTLYEDFRQMIEKEKLDAVAIETPTHPRAWISILAMQMGVDTYIEKPMCLTIAEGRAMVRAARKYERVTQVGTQQRSMPINNWASDLVKNGSLGKIHTVLAPNFVSADKWEDQSAEGMPPGGSKNWWDVWTNQAVLRPYHRQIHRGWNRWWDYDGGGRCFGVTGWGTHSYDQINRALGTDDTGPAEIWLEEPVKVADTGKYEDDKIADAVAEGDTGAGYHRLSRKVVGLRAKVSMRFANGTVLKLHLDGDRGPGLGAIFIGEKGKLEVNRNKLASNPKELILASDNPGPNKLNETQYHVQNFVNCIKSRQRCTADIEIGQRATTLCYLVNIVRDVDHVDEKLIWDPVAERFTNCEAGNQLLSRPRRAGWELPSV